MNTIQRVNTYLFILTLPLYVVQAQPSNNEYANATALTVQAVQCFDSTNGTLVDATNSGIATGCFGNKTGFDVWYTAVVPASGELSVETTLAEGSDARMILTAFTLENNSLTSLDCDDIYDRYSEVTIDNQTAGTTIYFQVAEGLNVQNNGTGGYQVPFSICAWDSANTPANDVYTSATLLPVDDASCDTPTQGTLANANFSELGGSCSDNGYGGTDVWYKLAIPASGELSIQTSAVESGSLATGLSLSTYRKENGMLTVVEQCVGGGQNDKPLFQSTHLTDQTVGDSIFVRITNFMIERNGDHDGYGYASRGTAAFQICAWNSVSLEIQQPTLPLLSYYSNPMGNRLRLESPYKIQSLAIHDLTGREVLTKNPQKQKLWLDTYSLSSGVYLLKVQTAEGQQTVKLVKK